MTEHFYDLIDQREFAAATNWLFKSQNSDSILISQIKSDPDLLAHCARRGAFPLVCFLVNAGIDLNSRPNDGFTPLFCSIEASTEHSAGLMCLEYLVQHGADVNKPGPLGMRPLAFAAMQDAHPAFQLLLANGADPALEAQDPLCPVSTWYEVRTRGLTLYEITMKDAGFIEPGQ